MLTAPNKRVLPKLQSWLIRNFEAPYPHSPSGMRFLLAIVARVHRSLDLAGNSESRDGFYHPLQQQLLSESETIVYEAVAAPRHHAHPGSDSDHTFVAQPMGLPHR